MKSINYSRIIVTILLILLSLSAVLFLGSYFVGFFWYVVVQQIIVQSTISMIMVGLSLFSVGLIIACLVCFLSKRSGRVIIIVVMSLALFLVLLLGYDILSSKGLNMTYKTYTDGHVLDKECTHKIETTGDYLIKLFGDSKIVSDDLGIYLGWCKEYFPDGALKEEQYYKYEYNLREALPYDYKLYDKSGKIVSERLHDSKGIIIKDVSE